jgi:hypothetical protein
MNVVVLEVTITFALSVFSTLQIAVTWRRHAPFVSCWTLKWCPLLHSPCKTISLL